jgi:hypothetical protein
MAEMDSQFSKNIALTCWCYTESIERPQTGGYHSAALEAHSHDQRRRQAMHSPAWPPSRLDQEPSGMRATLPWASRCPKACCCLFLSNIYTITLVIHALHLYAFWRCVALERDISAWLVDSQATPMVWPVVSISLLLRKSRKYNTGRDISAFWRCMVLK